MLPSLADRDQLAAGATLLGLGMPLGWTLAVIRRRRRDPRRRRPSIIPMALGRTRGPMHMSAPAFCLAHAWEPGFLQLGAELL
jgi:hypothetical protein